jgi:hypothetical protein
MKNNKGFGLVAVLLIIVAVLVVGGVAYYMGKSPSAPSVNTPENNYQPIDQNGTTNVPIQNGQVNNSANNSTTTTTTTTTTQKKTNTINTSGCQTLYWTDNNNKTCASPKQFCGMYMYQGLHTFATQALCQASLPTPVSTTLPTPYISAQSGWPPVIQNSSTAYSCNIGQVSEVEKIAQKVINGRTYCIDTESEGTAGSTYSTYTYTTANGNGTKTTNFVLRYVDCGVYSGPQMTQCKTAQSDFNLDAIVDSLM